jgi:hypothetical protein
VKQALASAALDAGPPSRGFRLRWLDWFSPEEWRALAEHAVAEGESVEHFADGGPCMVLGLMYSHFDDRAAHHLLLEHTCFPMSDTDALPQALEIIRERERNPTGRPPR